MYIQSMQSQRSCMGGGGGADSLSQHVTVLPLGTLTNYKGGAYLVDQGNFSDVPLKPSLFCGVTYEMPNNNQATLCQVQNRTKLF